MKLSFDPMLTPEEAEMEYKRIRTAYTRIMDDPRFLSDEGRTTYPSNELDLFRVISCPAVHDEIRQQGNKDDTLWERAAQLQTEIIRYLGEW
ncbi:MAG: hypothetical protein HYU56_00085 [Candidatus Aenigmarchaeota archaeon]|nr:hypothetical protein [Candidatus Aenigmarchaeota archaeon]